MGIVPNVNSVSLPEQNFHMWVEIPLGGNSIDLWCPHLNGNSVR